MFGGARSPSRDHMPFVSAVRSVPVSMGASQCNSSVQKGLEKKLPENYRPVSLLALSSKVLEKVVCEALLPHACLHCLTPNTDFYPIAPALLTWPVLRITAGLHWQTECKRMPFIRIIRPLLQVSVTVYFYSSWNTLLTSLDLHIAGLSLTSATAPSESFSMGSTPTGYRSYPASPKAAFSAQFSSLASWLTFQTKFRLHRCPMQTTSKSFTKFSAQPTLILSRPT